MQTVHVQIVTYNNETTVAETIEAALGQVGVNVDVLLIDNDSNDKTVEIAEKFPISIIRNNDNLGYSAAHNQGLKMCKADFVCTLNPDVKLEPEFLRNIIEAMQQNPNVGSASGCLFLVNNFAEQPEKIDAIGAKLSRNRRQRLILNEQSVSQRPNKILPIFGPDGAAAVYRVKMLQGIAIDGEYFDEDFFMHKEDIDVCWRAQLAGWDAIHVPSSKALHIRHFRPGKRTATALNIRFMGVRNRYLLFLKNERITDFLRDFPAIIFYEIGIFLYILLFERPSLRAYLSVMHLTPKMLKKRKTIFSTAVKSSREMKPWLR